MKKKLTLLLFWVLCGNLNAQRNVVLLIADDLGTDYFGFYEDHQDTVDVPNIRALLAKGIRFKNATSNPLCSSTRAGILTGRYSFRTGVGDVVGGTGGSGDLATDELTIPLLLKSFNPNIGTANIGKWHLHLPAPQSNLQNPNILGYDHFEGPFIGQLPIYTNWTKYTNGTMSTVTNYATSENVDNAISWLGTQTGNPFFLWLAFNAPHTPYHLPPANLHTYNLSGTQSDINNNPVPYFKASLQALDTEIGRLFDYLETTGKMDSTDIIFIGDNGNSIRTAQITNTDHAKGTIYEYGVHVPFIISGPSVVNPGRSSDALINTTDIFATVVELFGFYNWQTQIAANKPVDSKSILPIIKNQNTTVRPWAFCEDFKLTPDSSDGKAMRNMDFKLMRFDYDNHEEFYSLTSDPNETDNLLLHPSLTATEASNYMYLCSEMTTLVGTGSFCINGVNTNPLESENISSRAYPNPFHDYIHIENQPSHTFYQFYNSLGNLLFSGENIESHNFENLPSGIYFLKINESVLPLIKN